MTQLESAGKGIVTPQMKIVAEAEGLDAEFIREGVARGRIVIPANINHDEKLIPCGIGQGLKTKVNANIGTSSDFGDINTELEKLRVAIDAGSACSMCGKYCAMELVEKYLGVGSPRC